MSSIAVTTPQRIGSLDQFRGYSVAAMFIVNFLGGLAVTHHVLKHNNTHFSYADSIMPSFVFICGFAYRMSWLKRAQTDTEQSAAYRKFILRSLGLILLSVMFFGFGVQFKSWSEVSLPRLGKFVAELLKANMWEVLAILGALQILLMPLIGKSPWLRFLAMIGMGLTHFVLCWSFNYEFVYGRPNWMNHFWGVGNKRAWDGGFFGLLAWGQIMLAGTVAYDIAHGKSPRITSVQFIVIGAVAMGIGYGMSCLTRLYDLESARQEDIPRIVKSPVIPDWKQAKNRTWNELAAEPPFVKPPPASERAINYWMMDKRIVTQSFVWFSTGFAWTLYGLFVLACDVGSLRVGLFDVFGKNPLAAYIINHLVNHTVLTLVPKDSEIKWVLMGLAIAFGVTWLFVKFLDNRKLYLRL
jgi:predicted acyltransferase